MKEHLEKLIGDALATLRQTGKLTVETPSIQIEATRDKQHGDFACNIALMLSKKAGRKPRELAEDIVKALPASQSVAKTEIAGPGFINFFLTKNALHHTIHEILNAKEKYGQSQKGNNQRVLVEFVSSNPTGPLHVGHGRHAAFGAVIADLLDMVGYKAHREYYINDAGRQMDILAASVFLRYLALCGEKVVFPANGYQGEYVIDIAKELENKYQKKFFHSAEKVFSDLPKDEPAGGDKEIYIDAVIDRAKKLLGEQNYHLLFQLSLERILKDIREDLLEFGVKFDEWFSERKFVSSDVVDRILQTLKEKELAYEREGALWFRSTDFQDEKDRVLERANGQRTYFANDLAYHINKFERGFDFAIDVFGSDHHGYVPRMKAGLKAFGLPADKLDYLLLQFVMLYRGGEQVPMSTRSGSFVTLRELRNEVGNDAARFFYVMRRREQGIDFDLDLAKSKTNENPVFYVQYAHARICSVFRQLADKKLQYDPALGLKHIELLIEPHELQLLGTLARYPEVLVNAAEQYEPAVLTNYLRELANDFHAYYNAHQFLVEDDSLRQARLVFIEATRQVIANGLKLLGVFAPESM